MLLAIAMRQKKAALFIQQQIVKMRLKLLLFKPELGLHLGDRLVDECVPYRIRQFESVRRHPPDTADGGIDKCFGSLPVWRLLAALLKLR